MLTFDTDNLILLPFNGWPHLQNHLSYLFRTDSKQSFVKGPFLCLSQRSKDNPFPGAFV